MVQHKKELPADTSAWLRDLKIGDPVIVRWHPNALGLWRATLTQVEGITPKQVSVTAKFTPVAYHYFTRVDEAAENYVGRWFVEPTAENRDKLTEANDRARLAQEILILARQAEQTSLPVEFLRGVRDAMQPLADELNTGRMYTTHSRFLGGASD